MDSIAITSPQLGNRHNSVVGGDSGNEKTYSITSETIAD
jgi:hypothetical protein